MNVAGRGVKSTLPLHGMAHRVLFLTLKSIGTDIFTLPTNGDTFTFSCKWVIGVLNRQGKIYEIDTICLNVFKCLYDTLDKTVIYSYIHL